MDKRTLQSYFYESTAIVASILIAFALDALWADYQESKIEQRVLGELQDELQDAMIRVDSSIAELEGAIQATRELAEHFGTNVVGLNPETAQDLFNRMLSLNTLEVPSSVLDSIAASGQLRLISDSELRRVLSAWPTLIDDVRENHEWHRTETDEYFVPYFANYISIRNASIGNEGLDISPSSLQFEVGAMQQDASFEGRLIWRIVRLQATIAESKLLLTGTEKILALIAAEVE